MRATSATVGNGVSMIVGFDMNRAYSFGTTPSTGPEARYHFITLGYLRATGTPPILAGHVDQPPADRW